MRASHRWLKELCGVDATAEVYAERLTGAGLEVEALERRGEGLDRVVVAEVRAKAKVEVEAGKIRRVRDVSSPGGPLPPKAGAGTPHIAKDELTAVTVFDGGGEVQVVCGAPNVPEPGGHVLLARVGARLPGGMEIGERTIAGVTSRGMICSETELDIGAGEAGIVVLPGGAAVPGTPASRALDLEDVIFEIGVTPNRPDCLGHVGLAREVAVLSGVPFEPPGAPRPERMVSTGGATMVAEGAHRVDLSHGTRWADGPPKRLSDVPGGARESLATGVVDVSIADPDRCPRYGAALVLGVEIGPSPFWLRYRLHCLGVRAIHNVVDATNYALYEWGHPTHAFDLARVRGRRIDVRLAREGEKMATLDDVERTLTADDLLICDGEGPVAVAGVMGGAESEISADTRDVLIECAYFEPTSVRRTSRRLGLHTDASHRFERGVDPGAVPGVMRRVAQLVADLARGAVVIDALDAHPAPAQPRGIALRHARATMLNGFETRPKETRRILEGLGCEVADDGDGFAVTAPTWRPDLGREVDLIEEIVRVRGFDQIPTEIPPVRPSAEGTPLDVRFERRLRRVAAAAGLNEAIDYAFVAPGDLAAARVSTDAVPLLNPLSEDRSVLRTSLLPGLAAAARHSQRRQVSRIELFEVGHVFAPEPGAALPREDAWLGVFVVGPRQAWIGEGEPHDFYDGRGFLQRIVRSALGVDCTFALDDALDARAPFLHPRRRARVDVRDTTVGVLGELHPDVADALEIEGRPIYGELSLEALLDVRRRVGVPQARPLPRFPSVSRDISMEVDEAHPAGEIAARLSDAGGERLEEVVLFDLYRGEQIPAGRKSLAFRMIYRDPEGTLTDREVDRLHRKVAQTAEKAFGATLR